MILQQLEKQNSSSNADQQVLKAIFERTTLSSFNDILMIFACRFVVCVTKHPTKTLRIELRGKRHPERKDREEKGLIETEKELEKPKEEPQRASVEAA